uniref:Lipoprotein n=1 Tax=viral metagenome TaxID=1070528 RepID=A0A6M3KU07_9ZZZZ
MKVSRSLGIGLVSAMILVFVSGCGSLRSEVISWSVSDIKNVEAIKTVSDNLKLTWNFYSGCLDALQPELSGKAWEIKEQLDEVYQKEEWNDKASGKALVLRGLLVKELSVSTIKEVLPGFLELLTPLF